ncbi:hypothetical protein [Clostridium minihomine]|uniref:hypothetical protein n=1 Tax=Clostridium minihomine TaxID=2045012 RepID=UPI0013EC8AFF|nr:hypothetical protein [Clostridium minihomine]
MKSSFTDDWAKARKQLGGIPCKARSPAASGGQINFSYLKKLLEKSKTACYNKQR